MSILKKFVAAQAGKNNQIPFAKPISNHTAKRLTIETAGIHVEDTVKSKPIDNKQNNEVKVKTSIKKDQGSAARNPSVSIPILATISPIQSGLTVVCVRDAFLVPQVRNTFKQLATAQSKKIGLPMPDVGCIHSLYSGNPRQLEQAKGLALANKPIKNSLQHKYQVCGTRNEFDWFGDEGLVVLISIINDANGWVTLEQHLDSPIPNSIVDGLSRVRHVAQQTGAWVMLFVVGTDSYEKSSLHELCDEYVEVSTCEPDSGYDVAFLIDCINLRNLNPLGIGRTMCSIKLVDGVYHRKYTEFTSTSLETRMMLFMRAQEMTYEEIGDIFNKDKSTVQRRLKELKIPKCKKMKDGWLERYLESSGIDYRYASSKLGGKAVG